MEQEVQAWIEAVEAEEQVRQDVAIAIYPRGKGVNMSEGAIVEALDPESHGSCKPIRVDGEDAMETKLLREEEATHQFVRRLCIRRLPAASSSDNTEGAEKGHPCFGKLELMSDAELDAIGEGERAAAKRLVRARLLAELGA